MPDSTMRVINPATGEYIEEIPISSREEVDAAVERARDGFREWQGFAGLALSVLASLVLARRMVTQFVQATKHDRFSRANLGARRHQPALLSIVTEGAFECAAGVRQRLRSTIDHAERTGYDAVTTTITNVVLHEYRANFSPHDRPGRTRFQTTGLFAVLANVGQENPPERILVQ